MLKGWIGYHTFKEPLGYIRGGYRSDYRFNCEVKIKGVPFLFDKFMVSDSSLECIWTKKLWKYEESDTEKIHKSNLETSLNHSLYRCI